MTTPNLNIQPNVNNSSVVLAAQPSEIGVISTSNLLGRNINVYGSVENPFFLAKDVADWLELSNVSDMISRVDEEERSKFNLGRQGETWFLSEDGLYEALLQSRKPIAKQFKKGVKDILKQIRRTGSFNKAQSQPKAAPTYTLEEKFKAIELSCKMLRKSKASKARMVNAVIVPMGLPAFDYVESEGQFLSAKDLLEMNPTTYNGKKLASITFNKILIEQGYMEEAPQPRGKAPLKLLTDKGLKWGRNDDSPEHPGSIIAHYNAKKFPQFLKELGLN